MYLGLIPEFSGYSSCFNSGRVLVLLRLQSVTPATHASVLHPRAAGAVGNVPQCESSRQLRVLGQVTPELQAMWHSLVLAVLPHCILWKKDLKGDYKILSNSLLTNFRSNFLGINCCYVKWKRYCHRVTRQLCEKNRK